MYNEFEKYKADHNVVSWNCTIGFYATVLLHFEIMTQEEGQEFFDRISNVEGETKRQRFARFWQIQSAMLYNLN